MEKYKDCELNVIALFDENIDILIEEAYSKLESDSITKLSNTQWKYILSYIGYRLFPDNRLLLLKDTTFPNNKVYNYRIIYNLTVRYITLCYRYNKLPSLLGLSLILNIPYTTISNWNNDTLSYNDINNGIEVDSNIYNSSVFDSVQGSSSLKVSIKPIDIYNMILRAREGVLKDIAIDSKQVVGTLAVANNEFGWNVPGMTGKTENVRSLTAAELPKLEIIDNK